MEQTKEVLKAEELAKIITLWKDLKVANVVFDFSCGGDSMNDTQVHINTKDENDAEIEITNAEIEKYIEDKVYYHVDFYVNSDGHYQGEVGTVYIELVEDKGETPYLSYSKSSTSEWNETVSANFEIPLSELEIAFIDKFIINMNGGDNNFDFVFKADVFLTDADEEFLELLETKISTSVGEFNANFKIDEEFGGDEAVMNEWYSFNTPENNLTINDKGLVIELTTSVVVFKDGE
jgi:hypothetical protein